uniref:Cathepsin propeptide inhibitor domain-containing protein n=1 Tax=Callorhinchus milii TaxID=7868 RepID=A0A4W3JVS3_CALMI
QMKLSLIVSYVLLVVTMALPLDPALDDEWLSWKSFHGKHYMEEIYKRMIWEDNMRFIQKHNQEHSMGKHTFTVDINQFGDLFNRDESKRKILQMLLFILELNQCPSLRMWSGVLFPVLCEFCNPEGNCFSFWAFSATGALEGQLFKKTGKLIPLSEQNLIDCDENSGGCEGGFVMNAFAYVQKFGLNTEKAYPYKGKETFSSNVF